MILEFLTVAVETQPGLIELFLNLEVNDGAVGSKVILKSVFREQSSCSPNKTEKEQSLFSD